MNEIIDFILARLGEVGDCEGAGEYQGCAEQSVIAVGLAEILAEITEQRRYSSRPGSPPSPFYMQLATVWSEHPDFHPQWRA